MALSPTSTLTPSAALSLPGPTEYDDGLDSPLIPGEGASWLANPHHAHAQDQGTINILSNSVGHFKLSDLPNEFGREDSSMDEDVVGLGLGIGLSSAGRGARRNGESKGSGESSLCVCGLMCRWRWVPPDEEP